MPQPCVVCPAMIRDPPTIAGVPALPVASRRCWYMGQLATTVDADLFAQCRDTTPPGVQAPGGVVSMHCANRSASTVMASCPMNQHVRLAMGGAGTPATVGGSRIIAGRSTNCCGIVSRHRGGSPQTARTALQGHATTGLNDGQCHEHDSAKSYSFHYADRIVLKDHVS